MYTIKLLDRPPGSFWSKALALNSHGHAVGFTQVDTEFQPMLWNPNPKHFSFKAQATGINDSGDVVGFFEDISHSFLIRKNGNGKPEPLIKFDSFARAINNDGFITGTFGNILGGHPDLHAFIYNPDKQTEPIDLGVLPGDRFSQGYAINNKKQVTGLSYAHDTRAFFYDGAMMDLGPATAANDLNDAGQVVGARDVNGLRTAFLCETSSGTPQFEDIHSMEVNGINNNGDIVGSGQGGALVRLSGGGVQNLNSFIPNNSGWMLDSATRINDNGQIVGLGRHNGSEQSYLLTPGSTPNFNFDRDQVVSLVFWALAWGTAGVWFGPGTPVVPIYPPPPFQDLAMRLSPEKQEMLIGIVFSEFASLALEGRSRSELEKCALNMIRRALDQLT